MYWVSHPSSGQWTFTMFTLASDNDSCVLVKHLFGNVHKCWLMLSQCVTTTCDRVSCCSTWPVLVPRHYAIKKCFLCNQGGKWEYQWAQASVTAARVGSQCTNNPQCKLPNKSIHDKVFIKEENIFSQVTMCWKKNIMNKAETYIYISVYSEELGWTGHVSAKCISSSSGGRGQTKASENLWQKLDQHILSTRLTTGVLTTSVLPVLSDVSCCLVGGERRHFLNFRSYRDLEQLFWPCGMSSQAGKFLELLQKVSEKEKN